MAEKEQFKFYAEPQLRDRLERAAARCGYPSAQAFTVEALDLFAERLADFIIELRKIQQAAIKRQGDEMLAEIRKRQEPGPSRPK